jgi:hypothetical protein
VAPGAPLRERDRGRRVDDLAERDARADDLEAHVAEQDAARQAADAIDERGEREAGHVRRHAGRVQQVGDRPPQEDARDRPHDPRRDQHHAGVEHHVPAGLRVRRDVLRDAERRRRADRQDEDERDVDLALHLGGEPAREQERRRDRDDARADGGERRPEEPGGGLPGERHPTSHHGPGASGGAAVGQRGRPRTAAARTVAACSAS